MSRYVEFSSEFKIRDEKAVKKIMSGLMKLLLPNMQFDKNELESVARLALEYRQRVRDWLHILSPGEYLKEKLNLEVKA